MKTLISQQHINEMRDLGRATKEKGFFEIDMVSAQVTWVNEYVCFRWNQSLEDIQRTTLFEFIPNEFHEQLRSTMSEQVAGKYFKFSIWPTKDVDNRIVWWYVVRLRSENPFFWFRAEYLNTTDSYGQEYSSMLAAMATTNSYNELYNKLLDVQAWTEEQIVRLDKKDSLFEEVIEDLGEKIKNAVAASQKAATAANDVKEGFSKFQEEITTQLTNTTNEIVTLFTNDAKHEERFKIFDEHMKKTTAVACQSIVESADQANKNLGRRIIIPVGLITTIVSIIQWLLQNWKH